MKHIRDFVHRVVQYGATVAAAGLLAVSGAASAQDMQVIKVERSPVGQFQGLFLAQDLGLFKERGIELEIAIGVSPDGALAQLMSGQQDIAMTGAVPLVSAVANGLPVVAVLNGQDQGEVQTDGLLVPADSPIQTVADLKGKKVGLPGIASPQGFALLSALEKAGLSRDDIELVNLPFPGVLQAIESGSVDAGMPIGLFYDLGVSKGLREIKEVRAEAILGVPAVFFAANRQWADEHADLLGRFIEAMTIAHAYANENPDKVREIDLKHTKLPPDYLKNRPYAGLHADFDVEKWNQQNEGLAKYGFISRVPDPDEFIWSGAPRR